MEKLYNEKHSSLLDWSIIKKSTMIYTLVVSIIILFVMGEEV